MMTFDFNKDILLAAKRTGHHVRHATKQYNSLIWYTTCTPPAGTTHLGRFSSLSCSKQEGGTAVRIHISGHLEQRGTIAFCPHQSSAGGAVTPGWSSGLRQRNYYVVLVKKVLSRPQGTKHTATRLLTKQRGCEPPVAHLVGLREPFELLRIPALVGVLLPRQLAIGLLDGRCVRRLVYRQQLCSDDITAVR